MQVLCAYRYQMCNKLKAGAMYYGIIYVLLLLPFLLVVAMGGSGNRVSGIEMSNTVFLMVMSISTYKEELRMLLQNASSRKTMIFSTGLTCLTAAAVMSAIDLFNRFIFSFFYSYTSVFSAIYQGITIPSNGALLVLYQFLWSVALCFFFAMFGFFIGALFHRLGKRWRLPVLLGVPVVLFFLLPFVDFTYFQGAIIRALGNAFVFFIGLQKGVNPLIGAASFLVFGLLLYLFGALLTRRVPISD